MTYDVDERVNVWNPFGEASASRPSRVGHGDENGHARAKEADGCAILKRVAMMKTELRRVFNSRIWPKYYENMALKTRIRQKRRRRWKRA
ncbi:hypothetical protein T12_12483 [Trichinella patagoniensis]|uniref:Uncharacterized protein n=1 Tax=Trichinella patagoniensis TaxID=990121 RepID=A0A0V0YZL7_9BILA|nr:hypothetical protein T12_12483 [Trichinella patagoniensis]